MDSDPMIMWTVYDHPRDCPDFFIAREWWIEGGMTRASGRVHTARSLDVIREMMLQKGLTCFTRDPADDPVIIETWL